MALLILLLIGFVVLCFWIPIDGTIVRNHKRFEHLLERECYGTYILKQRDPAIKKILKIKTHKLTEFSQRYEPEKETFVGITRGNITTGGVLKSGGYNYLVSNSHKTDRGELCFRYLPSMTEWWTWESMSRIQLTPELYRKAQHSYIKEYLNDKMQICIVKETAWDSTKRAAATAISKGNFHDASVYQWQCNSVRGYPTYEKCQAILDWICGLDQPSDFSAKFSSDQ